MHGCLGMLREGQSIFYTLGPGVPHKDLKKISSIQIAATVAQLLEIQPPSNEEGKTVF